MTHVGFVGSWETHVGHARGRGIHVNFTGGWPTNVEP